MRALAVDQFTIVKVMGVEVVDDVPPLDLGHGLSIGLVAKVVEFLGTPRPL